MKQSKNYIFLIAVILIFTVNFNSHAQQASDVTDHYSRIDSYLDAGTHHGFSGAITVIKDGVSIINKGYGMANKDTRSLNTPNTIFDIGSNTKQFTATAILKLAEQGKLRLDDPISKFFKNLPADKKNITLHQLLTHTAGFPDTIGRDFDAISEEVFFDQLFSTQLLHKPGTKYAYSNTGYSVLGRIIERSSGQSYEAYLNQHLFAPAGMLQTGYLLPKWEPSLLARGYNRNVLETDPTISQYQEMGSITWHLKANGGINASQNDMILWHKALKQNTILSPESLKKLISPYVTAYEGEYSYGYGWLINTSHNNGLRVSHNGSNGTYSHTLIWYPEEDLFIVYATNANSAMVEGIGYEVEKIILNEGYTPIPIKNNVYAFTMDFIKQHSTQQAHELFGLLEQEYPDEFSNSSLLNTIGNFLLGRNQYTDWMLELFKKNVELYPEQGIIWDSLGDGYRAHDLIEEAISCYKKALELGYQDSERKLKELMGQQ